MSQAARARLFIDALVTNGVRDLVISPGSRSTPLALAASDHAALRTWSVIDERSAAFFALGQAKMSGRPSALLCTSGSAGAHYYPAVIEASYSHTPLIAITADRPPELWDCGAPQTVDQRDLYGRHARASIDLGAPEHDEDSLRAVVRKASQAVALALGPDPGPVHVNAPARKPLEQTGGDELELPRAPRVFGANAIADATAIAELTEACRRAECGLITCGPAPIRQRAARDDLRRLALATGFPVLAEASSQLRFGVGGCDAFDSILRAPAFRDRHAPDLIVQIGDAPLSSGWRDYLARHRDCPRWILRGDGWCDPWNGASRRIVGDVPTSIAALVADLGTEAPTTPWANVFDDANTAAWLAVERILSEERSPNEASVARAVVDALADGGVAALGNSMPIRSVDAFCRVAHGDLAVWHQRGANGIDGLVSGAAGAATASGQPTALLIGDVSFAHDLTGLAIAREVGPPLAIVVVDNGGGRIFEHLPVADAAGAEAFERNWLTPPRRDLEHAAATFGVPYARYLSDDTIAAALERPGCTVVHALVEPDAQLYRRVWAAVAEALP